MKKIIIAICILNASCKGPVANVQPATNDKQAAFKTTDTQPADTKQNAATVTTVKEVGNMQSPVRVEKKSASARTSEMHEEAYQVPEAQANHAPKDSTGTDSPGGGSDIEGYIPFIKQFYDN